MIFEFVQENQVINQDSRNHSFNVGVASDFCVNIALWLGQLAMWTEYHLANRRNIHDGLCWNYITVEALKYIFPYFTKDQIRHTIKKSIDEGLVVKGNYNTTKYDRTLWYALTPKAYLYFDSILNENALEALWLSTCENSQMDFCKFTNGFMGNPKPIPITNPSTNKNNNINIIPKRNDNPKSSPKQNNKFGLEEMLKDNPHNIPESVLSDWLEVRKTKKAKITKTAWEHVNNCVKELVRKGFDAKTVFTIAVSRGWAGIEVRFFDDSNTKNTRNPSPVYTKKQDEEELKQREARIQEELKQREARIQEELRYKELRNSMGSNPFKTLREQDAAEAEKLGVSVSEYAKMKLDSINKSPKKPDSIG